MRLQITNFEKNNHELDKESSATPQSQQDQSSMDFYQQQIAEYQTNINQTKLESKQIRQELLSLQKDNHTKEQQIKDLQHDYEQIQTQLQNRGFKRFSNAFIYCSLVDREIDLTLNEYQSKYEQQIRDYEKDLNRATAETERIRVELAKFEEEKSLQEKRTSLLINSLKDEYEDSRRQGLLSFRSGKERFWFFACIEEQDANNEELNQTIEKLKKDCREYQREIEEFMERGSY